MQREESRARLQTGLDYRMSEIAERILMPSEAVKMVCKNDASV
jgi:hypothetical protein